MKGQIAFEAQPFELDLESQGIGRSGRWFRRGSSIVVLPEIGRVSGDEGVFELSSGSIPSGRSRVLTSLTRDVIDIHAAERFANLALVCVRKEYPNKISHVLNSDADVAPPRMLTPAFYGCYDWHSSVHEHWLLVRLLRTFPKASFAGAVREALRKSLTAENLKQEAAYLRDEGR